MSETASSEDQAERGTSLPSQDTCFVLMPFGGRFDVYYEEVYRPAIEAAGLKPRRAGDLYRPGTIVNDIWSGIHSAKVLLADLTERNANVFYELGLAHAIAKPVILIANSIEEVPFDLRSLRVIPYDKDDPSWGAILREKIELAVREVLGAPKDAVLPTFLKIEDDNESMHITSDEKVILELQRDVDQIKSKLFGSKWTKSDTDEYRFQVERYMKAGIKRSDIVRRLIARGAPIEWVEREIDRQLEG